MSAGAALFKTLHKKPAAPVEKV